MSLTSSFFLSVSPSLRIFLHVSLYLLFLSLYISFNFCLRLFDLRMCLFVYCIVSIFPSLTFSFLHSVNCSFFLPLDLSFYFSNSFFLLFPFTFFPEQSHKQTQFLSLETCYVFPNKLQTLKQSEHNI